MVLVHLDALTISNLIPCLATELSSQRASELTSPRALSSSSGNAWKLEHLNTVHLYESGAELINACIADTVCSKS